MRVTCSFRSCLRFPQILTNQLKKVQRSFQDASREFNFTGGHFGVFPMKVNPRREVVEEFLREGSKYNFGVECGSKAELYAALSLDQTPESLLICNGFKDEAFINLALMGVQIGKRVIIVVEKLNELKMIIRRSQETGIRPGIGIRAKLYSKGSGKWASSGGESAKFGLTPSEMLECIRLLREFEMTDLLKLLHFHIGSQITDIKRVKAAMKEAARVYAKIRQMHIDVEFLDIGGGMGVDYDGSKTTFESSVNYTIAGVRQRRRLHDQIGLRRRERARAEPRHRERARDVRLPRGVRDFDSRRDRNLRRRSTRGQRR